MKLFLAATLYIITVNFAISSEFLERSHYSVLYDTLDTEIEEEKGVFFFDLSLIPETLDNELRYSIDNDETQILLLSETRELTILTYAGSHSLQFFLNSDFKEIFIFNLPISSQHRKGIELNFRVAPELQPVKKPVIYLYPEDTMQVSVEVIPKGEFTYTYPEIQNGWNFTCAPQVEIFDGTHSYPYLFWESEQRIKQKDINPNAGVFISGGNAMQYLNAQLTQFGLTSSERADFISFWGPQLQTKTNLYIYLLLDEECDAFASLKISPQPQNVSRIYVIWSEVPANYSHPLESQLIPTMNRDGFTVIEWGGAEVDAAILFPEDL